MIHRHCKVDMEDSHGRTALHIAAQRGHDKLLVALLQRDSDAEARNSIGWTPLLSAVFHGQLMCIKQLIRRSAQMDARDDEGLGVLHLIGSSPILGNVAMVPYHNRRGHARLRKAKFDQYIDMMIKERKAQERARKERAAR